VQTFLPYSDYYESAKCLDRQRLGKQRVEAWQILITLKGLGKQGWRHHPAVLMWKGYERSLAVYGTAMCLEWIRRGYKDTLQTRFTLHTLGGLAVEPDWLGHPDLHRSHRSNLIRKMPEHYGHLFPEEPNDLPYLWPVSANKRV
jgi:hypothetical protein